MALFLTLMSPRIMDIYQPCLLPLKHGDPYDRPELDQGLLMLTVSTASSIGGAFGIIAPEGTSILFNIATPWWMDYLHLLN